MAVEMIVFMVIGLPERIESRCQQGIVKSIVKWGKNATGALFLFARALFAAVAFFEFAAAILMLFTAIDERQERAIEAQLR